MNRGAFVNKSRVYFDITIIKPFIKIRKGITIILILDVSKKMVRYLIYFHKTCRSKLATYELFSEFSADPEQFLYMNRIILGIIHLKWSLDRLFFYKTMET